MHDIKPVTIEDLATKLGLSASTVSRAIRNHPDIKTETKEKVQKLAKKLDYHPHFGAQALRKKRNNTIGVIVPEIKHDFFSSVLDGIEEIAYKAGYTVIVCKSNEDFEREKINISAMMSNRVAGLLVSISQTTRDNHHFEVLVKNNIPLVFFDRVFDMDNISKVVGDDYGGAFQAVEHLILGGYERIAHLAGPEHLWNSQERVRGYIDALKKYHIPFDENLLVFCGLHEDEGIKGFQKILKLDQLPEAIFAVNDPVAIGVYREIKKNGLIIPDDIALIGFTGSPITSLIDPPLTTVVLPAREIGKVSAKLLIEQIESKGDKIKPVKKIIKTHLEIRKSTINKNEIILEAIK